MSEVITAAEAAEHPIVLQPVQQPASSNLTVAERALQSARDAVVDCDAVRDLVFVDLQQNLGIAKTLDAERKKLTEPFDNAKETVMGWFRRPIALRQEAARIQKDKIAAYNDEQEAKRRKAAQEAEAAALKERQRLEAQAAAATAKAEKEAKDLREKAEAEAAAGNAAAAAKLESQAAAKIETAENKVEALAQVAQSIPTSIVMPQVSKAIGQSNVKRYTVEVTDVAKLVAFVAQTPMFLNLLQPNDAALNALARAQKDQFQMPGCKLIVKSDISARQVA